ncbi:MAG: DUF2325 domain-containing protein [Clostridia bacterium]|nr:DUF2325 domain-containing protein [Clostridia bacterium]
MTVLIVGADRLGSISDRLIRDGVNEIIHWKGRCSSCEKKCAIPKNVEKIIVFCDFINHNLMGHIKKQAKRSGVPVIYTRRAISHLEEGLLA